MKKLGLDIGSSSLGWTLRNDDNTFTSGVITFKSGMVKGTGGYSSPTKDRREARSKRKLIQARKYRKWELLEILLNEFVPLDKVELENWSKFKKGQVQKFPENPNFLKWLKCDFSYLGVETKYKNPYELRISALDEKKILHKHELGRALYHLVQRRGYKDIGETDKETEKQIERRGGERGFQKALDENRTIAEALLKEFLDKGLRARNQYPYRDEYEHELFEILKAQGYNVSRNSKNECQNEFVQKVRTAIIWQRPLRTQKGNIGKCTLEPTKPRCPVSHPVFEIFRTWQFINTIKYYNENGVKETLGQRQRELLYEFFLLKAKNFKFEEIRNFLDKQLKSKKRYNYPIDKEGKYDTSVSGMPTCKGLIDVFGDTARNALGNLHQYNIGNAPKIINNYSIYDLWHILFAFDNRTAKDNKFLEKFSIEKLDIANERNKKGEEINPYAKLQANITTGYADLSLKAMSKIIPFLKDGYLYNEAVVLAKIPDLLGENWGQNKDTIEALVHESNEKYNWHKTIVSVTNNLIDQYKGLEPQETFAYKDFQYHLVESDLNDIEKACIGSFGEKTWNDKTENEKQQILDEVRAEYQEFFHDERRAYRRTILLTDILKEKLKEKNIEINGKLYHHSNIENKYLKRYTDTKTGTIKLPTHIDKDSGAITEILPQPIIDSIKNPMFNKAMSIVRKLINELIKTGKIDEDTEVVIEVARELNDNNNRAAIERYQREREGKREKYREFLNEFNQKENRSINVEESIPAFELWTEQIFEEIEENGKKLNKNTSILKEKEAIKRYELWTEQKGQCMYTGKMISVTQLFSNEIDIEHTIPRSLLPDNTMTNQTVAYAWYNRDKKKNQLPTQCANYEKDVEGWGTDIKDRLGKWEETRDHWKKLYEDRLKPKGNEDETIKNKRVQEKHYFKMHYDYWKEKVERFTAEEVKDSWARRQLVDTQMVSKYAREYLKAYFRKVAVQKGGVTAEFRKIYSFQNEGKTKDRNRHTHHAIDAAVLTLIPVNSSYRERILKEYFKAKEDLQPAQNRVPFKGFDAQTIIQNIETNTLIVNYEKEKILKQTFKNVRKRGKLQYLKNKQGKFKLDENNNKIPLKAKGDTVRSELYAQTYLGKIKDVERYEDGQPKRKGSSWEYKTGKDEFIFVKREPIDKVKVSDKLIEAIIDPAIKKLVKEQKGKAEIKDYQGKLIRHVRVRTNAGKEVKERVNYTSKYDYKNKFYSESGSLPYAVLLQNNNNERSMIPIASFELAKAYKKHGSFVIDEYLKKYDKENNTNYAEYPNKLLLKVGQKVIVLKEDAEYDKRKDIDFQTKRLYVITQFKYDGSKIMLLYHLEAQAKSDIDKQVKTIKDSILKMEEIKLKIPRIEEDSSITESKSRKVDFEKRLYDFTTRLKLIEQISDIATVQRLKTKIEEYKTESSAIIIEGETPILGLTKNNWNFLFEGEDFEVSLLGEMKWIKELDQNLPGKIPSVKKNSFNEIKEKEDILSEPEGIVSKSSLKKFGTFEDATESDAKMKASITPEQHLSNVTKRIIEIYANELKKPMNKNIHFRND